MPERHSASGQSRLQTRVSRRRESSPGLVFAGSPWRASALLEPFATAGVDVVLGKTPISVAGSRLAAIPPLRMVFELGVTMRF
jgi:hypothetical protein